MKILHVAQAFLSSFKSRIGAPSGHICFKPCEGAVQQLLQRNQYLKPEFQTTFKEWPTVWKQSQATLSG